MIAGILLAIAGALSYGFLGVAFEAAAKRGYRIWDFIFYKQLVGLVIGLALTIYLGLSLFDPRLIWLGFIGALSYVLTCASYLMASRERDISANWTILNLSVLLPLVVSVLWFNDKFTLSKLIGFLLTVVSILLVGGGFSGAARSRQSRWLPYIIIAFLLNGILAILFRWVPDGYAALFTAYFYGISLLMVTPLKLASHRGWSREKGMLQMSAGAASSHWLGMMLTMGALQLVGRTSNQAGVIVYPITNGFVIPVGVILGVIFLRQSIGWRGRWGVATGMAGLVCLFLR